MEEDIVEAVIHTDLPFEEYLHQPSWKVTLSDGRSVYSRSHRRSWLELRQWMKENPSARITGLYFSFRDNVVCVNEGEAEYFFTHALKAEYGAESNQYYFIGGYRDGDVVRCKKVVLPEIYVMEEQTRTLDDLSVKKGLITYENSNSCEPPGIGSK